MLHSYGNKKGFTLIELLLVILLVGMLSIVAISSYVNSTRVFTFLSNYKNVISSIRTARSFAIVNMDIDGQVPDRYGVEVTNKKVTLFADVGPDAFEYEPTSDTIIQSKMFDFTSTDYAIEAFDSTKTPPPLNLPLLLFYETGSGDLTAFQSFQSGAPGAFDMIDKQADKFITLKFYEDPGEREKHIVIFQVSGLAEEFTTAKLDGL